LVLSDYELHHADVCSSLGLAHVDAADL
jgi:hypothetical protein